GVLDDVLGGLADDEALGVESGAAGAAGDLVELPGAQAAGAAAVVFGQAREDDGSDGDVDADAEGVGAADDGQQALLGESFDQAPVFGEHARVVDADAGPHEA